MNPKNIYIIISISQSTHTAYRALNEKTSKRTINKIKSY